MEWAGEGGGKNCFLKAFYIRFKLGSCVICITTTTYRAESTKMLSWFALYLPEYSNILSSKSGNGEKICWFQLKNKIIIPTYVLMWFLFSPSPCAVNESTFPRL